MEYQHAEAFKLMMYQCEECRERERIWNSRDGVTPYIIGCRKCGGEASHVNWERDIYMPGYRPQKGERVFRDGIVDMARDIMRRRVEEHPEFLNGRDPEEIIERSATDTEGQFAPGWPALVEAWIGR